MRREFSVNGIRLEAKGQISLFVYDNDCFVIYPYVDNDTYDSDITVFIANAENITDISTGRAISPLYTENGTSAFKLRAQVGKIDAFRITRNS